MIRILQVLPRLRRGGSQAMVMSIYRELDRTNYQFDFIIFTPDHDDYYEEILELGGRVYHFTKLNAKNLFKVRREWDQFFRNHPEYSILHSHVRSFASIYIPIAKKHGLTTIIHSHSTSNGNNVACFIKSVLEYPLRYQADYLFSCSTEAGKWLFGQKAITKSNYRFIPNAIALDKFLYSVEDRERVRIQYNIGKETVVGHVGGFETPKNHVFIINCFIEFLKLRPNAKLMLVGDGTFENHIRNLCEENLIAEKVIFTGLQSEVGPYLSAMDVFLFPSLWEGLPVSVVEAQASGLQIILSDTITKDVEMTDLLKYYSLTLGPEKWAQTLNGMIPTDRRPATEENIERLAGFDCSRTIKKLEQFYSDCVRSKT